MNALEHYKSLLANHDWSFQYADDYSAWRRGQDTWNSICALAKQVDPDHEILKQYAPKQKG